MNATLIFWYCFQVFEHSHIFKDVLFVYVLSFVLQLIDET